MSPPPPIAFLGFYILSCYAPLLYYISNYNIFYKFIQVFKKKRPPYLAASFFFYL